MEAGGANGGGAEEFTVEYLVFTEQIVGGEPAGGGSPVVVNSPPTVTTPSTPGTPTTPPTATPSATQAWPEPIEFATPPSDLDNVVDADHDYDVPACFRMIDDVLDPGSPPGLAPRVLDGGELLLTSIEELGSFKVAKKEECWRWSMEQEMKSIEENKTWSLIDLPPGHKPTGLKWVIKVKRDETRRDWGVIKVKRDEHGVIVKHKARLVAKGYIQRQGIDFDEVFAPVA